MVEGHVLEGANNEEEAVMMPNEDHQGQPSARSIARKVVVVDPEGRTQEPILDTTEETLVDQDVLEMTTVTLGCCQPCGSVIHGEAELGGACLCGGVLCVECSKRRCVRCGHCVCLTCSVEIGGSVYCRRHAVQQLIGWALVILMVVSAICGIVALIWHSVA